MHKKLFNALYVLNILGQALFTLVTPAALLGAVAWLLNAKAGVGSWIYAVLIVIGLLLGFYSMIRFVISAMAGLERLENEQKKDSGQPKNEEKR